VLAAQGGELASFGEIRCVGTNQVSGDLRAIQSPRFPQATDAAENCAIPTRNMCLSSSPALG
jgi:hypothetical protein